MMSALKTQRADIWKHLAEQVIRVPLTPPVPVEGCLTRMIGMTLEATGCQAAVGDRCEVVTGDGVRVEAEVVGFAADRLFLMPTGDIHGVKPNARVIPTQQAGTIPVRA